MVLRKEIASLIKDLLKKNPQGLSITEIVGAVNINRNTAGRYLENLLVSGQVDMRRFGMAKIYMLSQRVPLSAVLSISSELVIQLDNNLRIVFTNEPFLDLIGIKEKEILGKNIEFTPVTTVFDESFTTFIEHIREGITGKEWSGEITLSPRDIILFCRIAPTVFDDGRKGVSVILEDITQRKQDQQRVEESERQFRLLAENSLDMIGRIKPDFTHIYASPAYTTTLGYLPEEVIGKNGRLFIHPDDVKVMESVGKVLTPQNSSATIRFRVKHKEGYYVWIESHVKAIFDEKTHGLSEYYAVTRDITERKLAEEKLQESEDRYRKLVEISPDAVFLHRDGKILYANPAAFRLLGASHSGEITGKNILDFVPPAFQDIVRTNIQKDLEGQPSPRVELTMLRIDGTPILVEGKGTATISWGKPAVQVAIRDITEQKRAEEALKIKERQLFSIYSNVPDVLFYLSVEPGNRFRFLTVNQSFLDKTHRSEEEVVGKFVHEVIPDPLFSRAREKYNEAIREKKTIRWEEVEDYPSGKRYGDCYITAVFDENGQPTNIIGSVHDSTEHKLLEEMLRESEGKLNAILHSIPDPMSMMDENLTILWANEPAKRFFGKDIIGKMCYEAYHLRQEPCEPYPCLSLKAFSDGKTHHHETTVIDSLGGCHFFECSANVALRDESGKPVAVLEISRDVTDRTKAEKALRQSEDLHRTLAESSNDLIFVIGRDDRVEYVNSFASALVGKPAEKIINQPRSSLFPPEVAANQKKALQKVFETGVPVRNEGVLTFAGRTHWFDHFLTPLKDADNHIRSVLGISRDITERKRSEEALRQSQGRLQLILDSTDDIIIMQDPEGKYLYFNSVSHYGISEKETLGSSPYDFLDREPAEQLVERVRTVAKTGRSSRYETSFVWKGRTLWFSDSLSPVRDSNGTITAVVTVSQNITERKRTEIALRESEATARALINAPTDSVILIDDKGTVLAINEIAASRFGKRSDDLVGTMSYNLLPKEVAQLRRALMAPILEKKESVRFVDERAGRWYDTVSYPILNENGDVKKIAIIARDITEQKNIEKQLRASEQLYQRLLEQSFDAIAIHKDNKIAYLNRRAAEILGAASPEELIGRPIFDLIHPDSRRDLEERLQNLSSAEKNPVPILTEKFFRVNGTIVTVEVMAIRFDDNGIPAIKVAFREIVPPADRSCGSDKKR